MWLHLLLRGISNLIKFRKLIYFYICECEGYYLLGSIVYLLQRCRSWMKIEMEIKNQLQYNTFNAKLLLRGCLDKGGRRTKESNVKEKKHLNHLLCQGRSNVSKLHFAQIKVFVISPDTFTSQRGREKGSEYEIKTDYFWRLPSSWSDKGK